MSILSGTTGSMGGTELFAAGCFTSDVAIIGAAVGMVVTVTPRTFPGPGITWQGFVSAPNVVTVKVCSTIAAFVTASLYDVQVNDGAAPATTLPTVTGSATLSGQTGDLTITLADGTQPTGNYLLSDFFLPTVEDLPAAIAIDVHYRTAAGTLQSVPLPFSGALHAAQGYGATNLSPTGADGPNPVPLSFRAVTGTPITVTITITLQTTLVYDYSAVLVRLT